MNHAHIALAFTLLGGAAFTGASCTSSQDLGCDFSETCPDGEGGGGSAPSLPTGMRVFITNATFNGDLEDAGGKTTGIDSANALCQAAADGASLGGHWAAWISDTTSDAVDRVADDGPWSLVISNETVYANRAAVGQPTPVQISDEHGALLEDYHSGVDKLGNQVSFTTAAEFWGGSLAGGRSSGEDCLRWRLGEAYPIVGTTASYSGVYETSLGCDDAHHLLCLEQKMAPTTVTPGLTKRVFVTSKMVPGSLVKTGSKTTPHQAADQLCAAAANDAGLGGTWKAWLSARDAAGKMVRATDRLSAEVTAWTLVDNVTPVFDQKSDLLGKPLHSIDQNEFGGLIAEDTPVWTGTLEGGAPASMNNCVNWSSDYEGDWGINGYTNTHPGFDPSWTGGPSDIESDAGRCSEPAALYCFEQ